MIRPITPLILLKTTLKLSRSHITQKGNPVLVVPWFLRTEDNLNQQVKAHPRSLRFSLTGENLTEVYDRPVRIITK